MIPLENPLPTFVGHDRSAGLFPGELRQQPAGRAGELTVPETARDASPIYCAWPAELLPD